MSGLTTHVLDTALGQPARSLAIDLYRIHDGRHALGSFITDDDGRVSGALMDADTITTGTYELVFHAGDYLRRHHTVSDPAFLDQIPIRFGIADSRSHYHVPLLLSPFGYSTYRGS